MPGVSDWVSPDEGGYAEIARLTRQRDSLLDLIEQQNSLFFQSFTLILPDAILRFFVNDTLLSLRIISALYGLGSLVLFYKILDLFINIFNSQLNGLQNIKFIKSSLSLMFILLPSNFLWNSLALRESSSIFAMMLFTYSLTKLMIDTETTKSQHLLKLLLLFGVSLMYLSRIYYGIYASTALVLVLFFRNRTSGARPQWGLIFSIFFSSALCFALLKGYPFKLLDFGTSKPISIDQVAPGIKTPPMALLNEENLSTKVKVTSKELLIKLESVRENNRKYARTALPGLNCDSDSYLSISLCKTKNWFLSTFYLIFRPFPVLDGGDRFLVYASIENVFWIPLVVTFFFSILSRKFRILEDEPRLVISFLSLFVIIFYLVASLTEGNLGSFIRHRSVVLAPLLILTSSFLFAASPQSRLNLSRLWR